MHETYGLSNFHGDESGASEVDRRREIPIPQVPGAHDASLHVIAIVRYAENASTKHNNAQSTKRKAEGL